MAETSIDDAASNWTPSQYAIFFETFGTRTDPRRPTIIVSHPTAPFERRLAVGELWSQSLLVEVAHAYLVRLNERLTELGYKRGLGLPTGWLDALAPPGDEALFGWLPIQPAFADQGGPTASSASSSHRLQRKRSDRDLTVDQTVILIAGERLHFPEGWRSTRSGFGLRVVLHLRENDGLQSISIASMTAHLPFAPYATMLKLSADGGLRSFLDQTASDRLENFTRLAAPSIAEAAQLVQSDVIDDPSGLVFGTLRFLKSADLSVDEMPIFEVEIGGVGRSALPGDEDTSYRFRARVKADNPADVDILSRHALVAGATADARVFEQDPSCWRDPANITQDHWYATRPTRELDAFRIPAEVPTTLQSAQDDFVIRNCPKFVSADPHSPSAKQISNPGVAGFAVRSNAQSAVGAYYNSEQVFAVMRGFGLDPDLYFRACQRPLNVFYRSGIRPGPGKNGKTINAWVRINKPQSAGFLPLEAADVEMHFALANLSVRSRDGVWAEPLGIAASERWFLHEFGHVLIAATLGDLEFLFAHSAGDGLAAICADPMSGLADPAAKAPARFRGSTFPWVFSNRRHDRCVLNGWSWSGTFQRPVTEAPEAQLAGFKGYISEQILSTTLFRLYLCLGGDTLKIDQSGADIERRIAASKVVLYLVMRAIESFGHAPLRAEELEAAMIDADVGLTTPLVLVDGAPNPRHSWTGGSAHKVVRWAFEAQGMHAPSTNGLHDAPGAPPHVDVFVADRRSVHEQTEQGLVPHGPGGYVATSLDWSAEAKWFNAGTTLPVEIGNRGDQPATDLAARIWVGILKGDPTKPGWDTDENIEWASESQRSIEGLAANALLPLDVDVPALPDGETAEAIELIVLIELSCPDDRANTDPLAGLPTAVIGLADLPTRPRALADLVANDNNLGLWRPAPPSSSVNV